MVESTGESSRNTRTGRSSSSGISVKLLIPAAMVLAAALAFVSIRSSQAARTLDDKVSRLEKNWNSGIDVYSRFMEGETRRYEAAKNLHELHGGAIDLLGEIETIEPPLSGIAGGGLDAKQSTAVEMARRTSDLDVAMETAVQFSLFEFSQEGEEHKKYAGRALDEIRVLKSEYDNDARPMENFSRKKPEGEPEYIFVVLFDATRADHLGCYGHSRDTSPRIDAFAEKSLLFENCISQASLTDTSVASLFTGLYPLTHRMFRSSDWLWEESQVENFRRAGFLTGGFSANALVTAENHYDYGFDHFEEIHYGRASIMVNRAMSWLDRVRGSSDRIFAYIHLIDPHDVYMAPGPDMDRYDPGYNFSYTAHRLRELLDNEFVRAADIDPACAFNPFREKWGQTGLLFRCISLVAEGKPSLTPREAYNLEARYDGEIRYSDAQFGRFVDYLEDSGMIEHSTIVVTGDHGESFFTHNQVTHGSNVYDELIHVPLIVHRPGDRDAGKRERRQVELFGLFPALLDEAGEEPPAGVHGKNLFALDGGRQEAYSFTWSGLDIFEQKRYYIAAVREQEFKYIATLDPDSLGIIRDEFYHLASDPGETLDASGDRPNDYARMKEKMERWIETTDREPPRPVKRGLDEKKKKKLRDLGYIK